MMIMVLNPVWYRGASPARKYCVPHIKPLMADMTHILTVSLDIGQTYAMAMLLSSGAQLSCTQAL
jgi:hypothetical protein